MLKSEIDEMMDSIERHSNKDELPEEVWNKILHQLAALSYKPEGKNLESQSK